MPPVYPDNLRFARSFKRNGRDDLREELTLLLDGKVGLPCSAEQLKNIYKEGEQRYQRNIPPGYSDARTKEGDEKYGDLIIWFQILDKAKESQRPVILVNDDTKEDWWWKFKGKTISPRPELAEEMHGKANVSFYMYPSDLFMEKAREHLRQQVDQQAIEEVRDVRSQYAATRLLEAALRGQLHEVEKRRLDMIRETHHLKHKISKVEGCSSQD